MARKPSPRPVTLDDLHDMHQKAAKLVLADPAYLPIFERIEREISVLTTHQDLISRVRAIAAGARS